MLKPLALNFRPDLSTRLKDIAKKQVSAKAKPMVVGCHTFTYQNLPKTFETFRKRSLADMAGK